MSVHPTVAAVERPERDFSFLESLSLDPPHESLTLGYPQEKLSLFPAPSNLGGAHLTPDSPNLRRTLSKTPTATVVPKDIAVPAVPKAPVLTKAPPPRPSMQARAATAPKPQLNSKPSRSNMPPSNKAQAQCLELCHKSTVLGNRVSVHLLEYMTSVTTPPPGFESLANEFLDTMAILISIEAGLGENSQRLPSEMISELENKFRVTSADFQALDHVVNKMLENELGTKSRFKRGWGKMFGDNDLTKHRAALAKTRESLKISALVFQWSMGNDKMGKDLGIGFTGLAAALDRLDEFEKKSSAPAVKPVETVHVVEDSLSSLTLASESNNQSPYARSSAQSQVNQLPQYQQHQYQQQQQQHQHQHQQYSPPPSMPWPSRYASQQNSLPPLSPSVDFQVPFSQDYRQYSSPHMHTVSSVGTNEHTHPWNSGRPDSMERAIAIMEDSQSHTGTVETDSLLNEVGGVEINPEKAIRLKADPASMPRWAPRTQHSGPEAGNMRAALVSAIRSRNHKLVEQLLDRGVPANTGSDLPALKEAVLAYDVESVRTLLVFGADPNDPDRLGVTPLFAAVEKSFLAGATELLKYGADPNLAAGPDMESPLAMAVNANLVGFTHLLLIYNGDVNSMTASGNTLLISAIKKKTPKKFIELLFNYGALPNAKSREGKTALFEAIQLGRADLVKCLLDHGADPNLPGPKHMLWPSTYQAPCLKLLLDAGADHKKCPGIMELATSLNNIESVRILLKAGVNPNAKKDGVYTPLCTSIRDDRSDIFELLLSSGADPNTPASEYPAFKCITHHRIHFLPALVKAGADLHSPKGIVETAVKFNNMDGLNWLLDQGLSPNEKNPKGHSPLTTAIAENRVEMVDLLLHRGADPNMRGQDWPVCLAVKNPPILSRILATLPEPRAFKGVMEMAVSANQLESVKLLIAAGVSVEDKNGGVFSPLTTALRENHRPIVRYLLTEAGADVNSPGEHLPVVKALRRFHGEDTEMLELLLDHGADPNLVYRGWNGMMQAVENGDEDVLKLIVKRHPVDLDVKDELGRNVVKIAESRGWTEAVSIIMGKS